MSKNKHPNTYVRRKLQEDLRFKKIDLREYQSDMGFLEQLKHKGEVEDDNYYRLHRILSKNISRIQKQINLLRKYYKYFLDQKHESSK